MIENIFEFAKTGERSDAGLELELGFPRNQKPARQWFNSLLHSITFKTNEIVAALNAVVIESATNATNLTEFVELITGELDEYTQSNDLNLGGLTNRLTILESTVVETYAIGDIYITTKNHTGPESINTQHGYGTWQRYGKGRVLVGQSVNEDGLPGWTQTLNTASGTYNHKLTEAEMPSHIHKLKHGRDNGSTDNNAGKVATDTDRWSGQYIDSEDDNVERVGGDQAHNNVQPSIVVAFWVRIA